MSLREPESISLEYNPWGKPALAAGFADSDIRFNLSHSHGVAAYAIARGREVGVDVEMLRPDFASGGIAERFFSRTEIESLRSLPREHQTRAFFVCWTRKEAYVKALGCGLSIDLGSFDVSLRPEERPALLRWRRCSALVTGSFSTLQRIRGRHRCSRAGLSASVRRF